MLQHCNVVDLRMLANCCMLNCTPLEIHGMRITLAQLFYQDFRVVIHSLFTLILVYGIPPTWRRGFMFNGVIHCTWCR